jgi:DNA-binding LacI/PurR family transcriptional regulator
MPVGFERALEGNGIEPRLEYVRDCDWTQESGRAQTLDLLSLEEPPTAVVGASDDLALGALAASRERGLSLPQELAIVSFDDPYFGALLEPPLTALTSRPRDIGRLAASHLLAALSDSPPAVRDVRLPVTLVRRRSCGCESR